ncbi:hypothetical protein E2C01_015350 [Portunus trituberculatus]|uniref:Uncharacterized protein n=1 Tax=Portunus trituberculatus TaxID=210409 RepID=A0A5B7DLL4_PORTR|nr:hypothetical protein [Portunus trituberculatus]
MGEEEEEEEKEEEEQKEENKEGYLSVIDGPIYKTTNEKRRQETHGCQFLVCNISSSGRPQRWPCKHISAPPTRFTPLASQPDSPVTPPVVTL